ncbi:Bis(5'-adenosyl)-triphosphatase [Geodia barretti]|uniref:Bis(5'-adenosyl)-triphosphatase n=1 Tax=Geodia barretti TaxID=519541 RepID=A0AA35SP18_GEOBA|nr:Bis(5'-adenosyl)-triphosphatase [Geodia barretti]
MAAEQALRGVLQFGSHVIPRAQVFLLTPLSFAFTNRKPILPGHVLVATRRPVERFQDLSTEEVGDLFHCAHRVAPVISRIFGGTSLTISVQDGPDAGQTVKQVHVHIIPRRPGDFQRNDDIYHELEEHDSGVGSSEEGKFRSHKEMTDEAARLAVYFPDPH